uniref:Uncharacterized protein n=1 Tax=Oryza nivara TaxID=4536 RepID=A0A0E0I8X2_ORYNI
MEEEKGMMGKQEKEKMLLQAAYDGNLRLLRSAHRRRLTSDLPEQPLVDASAAATDFPGAAFLPPSADIRSIGNYFSVQSPLSGHRVFPNKNLLEEHLLLHQLGTSVCCTKNVIVMYLRNVLFC